MPSRDATFTVHPALGGLDISSDPSVLDPNFLTIADNIEYLEGGQRKKRPGLQIYSTSTGNTNPSYLVSSSDRVRAVADMWRYAGSLTPTQDLLAVAGKSIFHSTGDGVWAAVTTTSSWGAAANTQTMVTLAGDYAVLSDESAEPIAYNQSILTGSSGNSVSTGVAWPRFTGSVFHVNRLFVWGISTAPDTLQYMADGDIFDSTGSDAGTFKVAQGDGDRIMAVSRPFYAALYLFKGPQFGSIWQLSGSQSTDFSLVQVGSGAPPPSPRVVVTTPTDVFWLSQYGVHSLQTTVKFGNVEEAFLSLPVQKLWREHLIRRDKLDEAWAFWHPSRSIVGWCVYAAGDSQQRWILAYNYALSDPKPGGRKYWSIWKFDGGFASGSILRLPATWDTLVGRSRPGQPAPMFGGDDGTVYLGDSPTLSDAGTAYAATVRTPVITRFPAAQGSVYPETQEKVFQGLVTYFNPKGNYTATVTVHVDRRVTSTTISLIGGGATLT